MKKLFTVLNVFILIVSLTACGSLVVRPPSLDSVSDSSSGVHSQVIVSSNGITVKNDGEDIYSTNTSYKKGCPNVESEVLYDQDNIILTVKEFDYDTSLDEYYLRINVSNQSDSDIACVINRVSVNGYSIEAMGSSDVYAGMNSDLLLQFSREEILDAGIEKIMSLRFKINIEESKTDDDILNEWFEVKTSEYGSYEETYSFDGEEVFNNEDISISIKQNDKYSIEEPLYLFMKNKTDKPVSVTYEDIAFNNQMVMDFQTGVFILPNSYKACTMRLYTMFMEDVDIPEIDTMTVTFGILPYRTDTSFSTADSYETDKITINFKE